MNDLIKLMKDKKLTRYRVAKDLNVSESTVGRWLDGETSPNIHSQKLIKLYLRRRRGTA